MPCYEQWVAMRAGAPAFQRGGLPIGLWRSLRGLAVDQVDARVECGHAVAETGRFDRLERIRGYTVDIGLEGPAVRLRWEVDCQVLHLLNRLRVEPEHA